MGEQILGCDYGDDVAGLKLLPGYRLQLYLIPGLQEGCHAVAGDCEQGELPGLHTGLQELGYLLDGWLVHDVIVSGK